MSALWITSFYFLLKFSIHAGGLAGFHDLLLFAVLADTGFEFDTPAALVDLDRQN
jgi:hypothetical protein